MQFCDALGATLSHVHVTSGCLPCVYLFPRKAQLPLRMVGHHHSLAGDHCLWASPDCCFLLASLVKHENSLVLSA